MDFGEAEWLYEKLKRIIRQQDTGEEIMVDSRLERFSITHFSKDIQRRFNNDVSSRAEVIQLPVEG